MHTDIRPLIPDGKRLVCWTLDPDDPNAETFRPGEKFVLTPGSINVYAVWTDDEIVPAPTSEVPQLPQTGDSAPLGLWIALIIISCTGAALLPLLLRGKERRN